MSRLPLALLAVSALAACGTSGGIFGSGDVRQAAIGGQPRAVDREARAQIASQDMLTQMAFWANEYNVYPNDLEAAQRFAESLRLGGRADRAVQISQEALGRFPDDRMLLTTYAMAQLSSQRPQEAVRPLTLVAQAEPQNWRVRSALGVALDQTGRYEEARRAYQEALALRPEDAGILTNLGMSHLIAGEPAEAETVLRQALALPNPPPQARQNLAVALALQGRFDEAEQLEQVDLPPATVRANMIYLRGLLEGDNRRWGDLDSRS